MRAHTILKLASVSDAAWCDLEEGDASKAWGGFQECLRHHKEWNDGEREIPYDWAQVCFGLAFCCLELHDKDEAIRFGREGSSAIKTRALVQADVARSEHFLLACIITQCAQSSQGLHMHKQVLAARRRLYGDSNFLTAQSKYVVAALEARHGNLKIAE